MNSQNFVLNGFKQEPTSLYCWWLRRSTIKEVRIRERHSGRAAPPRICFKRAPTKLLSAG